MAMAAQQQMSPQQVNAIIRQLILRGGVLGNIYYPPAVDMWQQLNPVLPSTVGPGSVITIQLRNVGLVKRLVLEIKATVTAGAGTGNGANLTALGLANFFSNITFVDLGNNTRINTTGWHLQLVSSVKRRRVFGAAFTSDTPMGYGNVNNRVMQAPLTLSPGVATEIDLIVEIPFVKANHDLRGAIFADVTNAVMQCQLTINPQMFVSNTADPTLAVYQSASAVLPALSAVTIQCNQNYLDQLPRNPQTAAPILPALDLGTAYLLNNTSGGLPVVNQDNGTSFVNARSYESVAWIYDNNGVQNINASDVNYIAVTSANFTNILRVDGRMAVMLERDVLGDDFPKAVRYLDFRHRPVNTDQYGNMQLIVNPSSVRGSAAVLLFGWEAYGVIGQVNQGGSLPMGS
jgi:P3 major capsid protein